MKLYVLVTSVQMIQNLNVGVYLFFFLIKCFRIFKCPIKKKDRQKERKTKKGKNTTYDFYNTRAPYETQVNVSTSEIKSVNFS